MPDEPQNPQGPIYEAPRVEEPATPDNAPAPGERGGDGG